MNNGRNGTMGRFNVELELANHEDMVLAKAGHLAPGKVRKTTIPVLVDSGAVELVLPKSAADMLGLAKVGTVQVRYADQRREQRDLVDGIWLKLLGRTRIVSAIVEPNRQDALLGAVVLEVLDLLVDCKNQQLIPRDPQTIISEIE